RQLVELERRRGADLLAVDENVAPGIDPELQRAARLVVHFRNVVLARLILLRHRDFRFYHFLGGDLWFPGGDRRLHGDYRRFLGGYPWFHGDYRRFLGGYPRFLGSDRWRRFRRLRLGRLGLRGWRLRLGIGFHFRR